jgi:hypothetical protein
METLGQSELKEEDEEEIRKKRAKSINRKQSVMRAKSSGTWSIKNAFNYS